MAGNSLFNFFGEENKDITHFQKTDSLLSQVFSWVEHQKRPNLRKVKGKLRFPRLVLKDDVLCHTVYVEPDKPQPYHVVIPDALVKAALHYLHGDPCAGHYSAERTLKQAQGLCYWLGMRSTIEQYCELCEACELWKSLYHSIGHLFSQLVLQDLFSLYVLI